MMYVWLTFSNLILPHYLYQYLLSHNVQERSVLVFLWKCLCCSALIYYALTMLMK